MKSKAVWLGHPIHPMLIPFPFAFLTGAVLFDAAGWFRDVPSWWTTGGHLNLAGVATALLAAIPGLIDYFYTVPPDSSGKARATRHMAANLSAVVIFCGRLVDSWRRGRHRPTRSFSASRSSVLDCSARADIWGAHWSRAI